MPAVLTELGKARLTYYTVSPASFHNWEFYLYKNDYTPVVGSVLANFVNATFPGYAVVAESTIGWDAAVFLANKATAQMAIDVEWICTGAPSPPETVYGWVMTEPGAGGEVLAAKRFATPVPITDNTHIRVRPSITLRCCTAPPKLVDGGLDLLLDCTTGLNVAPALKIKLYKNTPTWDVLTTVGDLTEADFGGYNEQALDQAWSLADPGIPSVHGEIVWVHDGSGIANTVRGYYVVSSGGVLLWGAPFASGGYAMDTLDDTIRFDPYFGWC
jgi:hypothetical protein